ncbi:uncharacterized protein GGQ74_002677 [Desulfobaculum xiamenense]|uniref:DUF177 domain-containing protein n=1 Tax=Desulfobaculum xiamenense TaxID=995050 RepID=A0A846QRJ0_9BACT|nr:DUF177 domain-containing protein [Desulfobaculum xiamenense]NJB68983.1 uncharacterized protein [Desulfobaculum xiamenense]
MAEYIISMIDIPAEGREFTFTDQELWSEPAQACGLQATIVQPLEGRLSVFPQGPKACLVRGTLTGRIILPCDRCMNDAPVDIEQEFDIFEEIGDTDETDEPRLREEGDIVVLDAGAILWEQFLLALPAKPLCTPDCKGLCSKCGADLNEGPCGCSADDGDPRMAALRGLTIPDRKKH